MADRLILIRHAAVEPDPRAPAALWPLSDEGRQAARALAQSPLWQDVERIFTSPEIKAQETAQIVAGPNGITVTAVEDLREVERPADQWFSDYPRAVAEYFAHLTAGLHGWEPPAAAWRRMQACVDRISAAEAGTVGIAGHGLTFALYLAALTGGDPATVWAGINLPDIAIVDPNRRVLRQPFRGRA